MWFILGKTCAFAAVVLSTTTAAEPKVTVDRLVSDPYHLQKRDSGYANGGNELSVGYDYRLSFFHINDVHA